MATYILQRAALPGFLNAINLFISAYLLPIVENFCLSGSPQDIPGQGNCGMAE
jgi:hypothetical protein